MIHPIDIARFHRACKLIEVDAEEAYRTCCQRFGTEMAGVLLVAFYRHQLGAMDSYPPEGGFEAFEEKVNKVLSEKGMIQDVDN